jgi:hypothetical protein
MRLLRLSQWLQLAAAAAMTAFCFARWSRAAGGAAVVCALATAWQIRLRWRP